MCSVFYHPLLLTRTAYFGTHHVSSCLLQRCYSPVEFTVLQKRDGKHAALYNAQLVSTLFWALDCFTVRAVPAERFSASFIRQNYVITSLSCLAIPLLVKQGKAVNETKSGALDSIPIGCSYAVCSSPLLSLPPHPLCILALLQHRHHQAWWWDAALLCCERFMCLVNSWNPALPRGLRDF